MSTHRYIIPQKQGVQHLSGVPIPELDPVEFVEDEATAMDRIQREARAKGLALGDGWMQAAAGWELLEVWQCQEDKEAPGRPYPPIGRVMRTGV